MDTNRPQYIGAEYRSEHAPVQKGRGLPMVDATLLEFGSHDNLLENFLNCIFQLSGISLGNPGVLP